MKILVYNRAITQASFGGATGHPSLSWMDFEPAGIGNHYDTAVSGNHRRRRARRRGAGGRARSARHLMRAGRASHDAAAIPKGQNLTQRTLEHFYFWGIVDELRAARLMPPGYPIGGITAYGNLMSDYWFAPPGPRGACGQFYFQDNERLPQYLTEEVLRSAPGRVPQRDELVRLDGETIEQDDSGVRVSDCTSVNGNERGAGGRIRGRMRWRALHGARAARHRSRRRGLRPARWCWPYSARRHARGAQALSRAHHVPGAPPELKGYWQFFGRVDVGEGWFFHAPVPLGTTPG